MLGGGQKKRDTIALRAPDTLKQALSLPHFFLLALVLWLFFLSFVSLLVPLCDSFVKINVPHMLTGTSVLPRSFKRLCLHFVNALHSYVSFWRIGSTHPHLKRQGLSKGIFLSSEIYKYLWQPQWTLISCFVGPQSSPATQGAWLPAAMPHSSPAFNSLHQAASS